MIPIVLSFAKYPNDKTRPGSNEVFKVGRTITIINISSNNISVYLRIIIKGM